jgi:hypothetical protein
MSYVTAATVVIIVLVIGVALFFGVIAPRLVETPAPDVGVTLGQQCQAFCRKMDSEAIYQPHCSNNFGSCDYDLCTCIPNTLIEKSASFRPKKL